MEEDLYEELDLRPYIMALVKNWMWIIGAGLLAGLIAFGVSSLLPPTYEATALVAITENRQIIQFDPRFENVQVEQPLGAYPELALSDELLSQLLEEVGPSLAEVNTVQELRDLLETETGSDPTLVRLIARHGDPQVAADLANNWASLFTQWANQVYGSQDDQQLAFFEAQLETSREELTAAEERVIEFQAQNRSGILLNQLTALQETQTKYLVERRELSSLLQDIQTLQNQLANQSGSGTASFADQLSSLVLQLRAYSGTPETPLYQLQLDTAESISNRSRAEQVEYLQGLASAVESRVTQVDEQLEELEPQIMEVQRQKEEADVELMRLTRERDVADTTYLALATKVEEERSAAEGASQGVRLASTSAVPERSVASNRLLYTVGAAALGGIIAVAVISGTVWAREQGMMAEIRAEDEPHSVRVLDASEETL